MSEKEEEKKTQAEPEKKEEKKAEAPVDPKDARIKELEQKVLELNSQYETADKAADEWKNKYYQAYADMANTRKQVEKETAEFKQYATKSFIEELIPTMDSFDMALKAKPTDEKLMNYLKGFEMIQSKLQNVLRQAHVVIVDPKVGDEYDPTCMQAFDTVEGEESNKVADVFTKGYKLHDHMLRPAGVIITMAKPKQADDIPVKDAEDVKKD